MTNFFPELYVSAFALGALSSPAFWPYFAAGAILIVGIVMARKYNMGQPHGVDRIVFLGPLLMAIAMAVFGADHFVAAPFVAKTVPSWIPGHLFWAYFVGAALITAALSLATKIQPHLSAALLGIMIFLFVLLIHIPSCFATPYDKTRLTIVLRDSTLSIGALAFAASRSADSQVGRTPAWLQSLRMQSVGSILIVVARFLIAISIAVFGIDQYLYPTFAPGIPQEGPVFVAMPAWIPGHVFWAYLSGTIFIVCAIGLTTRKYARSAATVLGLAVLALALFIYLPITIAKAADIANGLNYLAIHFALAGAALLLAGSLSAAETESAAVAEVEPSSLTVLRGSERNDCITMSAPRPE
jgi:uncharacterized membrane protein